jgi:hypothetical protein
LTEAELDLIAPHPHPPTTRWIRDINDFVRRDTHEGAPSRYG